MKSLILAISLLISGAAFADAPKAVLNLDKSIVWIKHKIQDKEHPKRKGWASCSGVYITPNVVLTAAHCFPEDMNTLQLWIKTDGVPFRVSSSTPILSRGHDLALFYVALPGTPVELDLTVKRGDSVYSYGNPLGMESILTEGIISRTDFHYSGNDNVYLVIDNVVMPGNSGGGIFTKKGKLAGIVLRSTCLVGFMGASGLGMAINGAGIMDFLREVANR